MAEVRQDTDYADLINRLLPMIRQAEASHDSAISPQGAIGRYQIMPSTARALGFNPAKLKNPSYNEKAARAALQDLIKQHGPDEKAILAGYNASPRTVAKWKRAGRDDSVLPKETRNYFEKAGFGPETTPPEPAPRVPVKTSKLGPHRPVQRTGEILPKELGWEYGQVLPFAYRPIPYSDALQPQLALPDIVRTPINELTKAVSLPGRTVLGQAAPTPENAADFALAMTGLGFGTSSLAGQTSKNILGAIARPLPRQNSKITLAGREKAKSAAFSPIEHDPFLVEGLRFEPVDHDPFE